MENKTVAEVIEFMKQAGGCTCTKIFRALGMYDEGNTDCHNMTCAECNAKWLGILMDTVEREKADAVSAAMERTMAEQMREWADDSGLPAFREDEGFAQWLDRYFLPRPRYEDGKPAGFGDWFGVENEYGVKVNEQIAGFSQMASCSMRITCESGNLLDMDDGELLKRPAEVLGADGLHIVAGETVYDIETGEAYVVRLPYAGTGKTFFEGGGYLDPAYLTHTPPDTQERIDADAREHVYDYWDCCGYDCKECPARVDGKTPIERFGVNSCALASRFDLLRRQRELDARKGGAE